MCKIMNFKAKNGEKSIFAAIRTKPLTRYGQKVDFFIRPMDCIKFWTIL